LRLVRSPDAPKMTSVVAPGVGSMRRLSRRGLSSGTIDVDDTEKRSGYQFPVASFQLVSSQAGARRLSAETEGWKLGTGNWQLLQRLQIRLRLRRPHQPQAAQGLGAKGRILLLLRHADEPVVVLRHEQPADDRLAGGSGRLRKQHAQLLAAAGAAQRHDRD